MTDPNQPTKESRPHEGSNLNELEQIFSQVVEASVDQQAALLTKLCPNPRLREQVRKLLDADSLQDTLLDHSLCPTPITAQVGELIDGYKLVRELAQGGMGVVFLAEQLEPVQRNVALKVIKPGVDTREVIARFNAERQALSLMDHPNIAKVLDAGSTQSGRPYFVMELVQGQAITTYCDERQLSTKQRLELFISVCLAIQHAHQKGIIHRDIKPSNVLIAEYDGQPVAKVIDFGVAKAINHSLSEMTFATGFGQIIGTFEYMSPEQSRLNQLDVDTRTDIYSLGVLLYELLTGCPPFEKERIRSAAWDEMLRIIREEDPPKPSSRLSASSLRGSNNATGTKRDLNASAKLSRIVKGELDWIVMKAMDKDRNRRYETPSSFAKDIERHLCGEAVSACPPSTFYVFRKFARRNKVLLATSAIVAASLVLGLVGTTWQAIKARRAEASSQAVIDFLFDDILGLADAESQLAAGWRPDPDLKLTTVLDRASEKVNRRFVDQPKVKKDMQATLASSYSGLGRYEKAELLRRDLLQPLLTSKGWKHPETIRAMRQLGRNQLDQSRLDKAEAIYDIAFENSVEVLGNEDELTVLLLNDRGILYQKQKKFKKAELAFQECLRIRENKLASGHSDTLGTMSNLAAAYEARDLFEKAESLHQQVLVTRRDNLPDHHPRIADALHNFGRYHLKLGRHTENTAQFGKSLDLLHEGLNINLKNSVIRGPSHPATTGIQYDIAHVYLEQRRFEDALPKLEELVKNMRSKQTAPDDSALEAMSVLGWTYMRLDRLEEAESIFIEVLGSPLMSDPIDRWTLKVRGNLAITLFRLAKLKESIEMDQQTLKLANEMPEPDIRQKSSCMARLGLSYLETDRTTEGRTMLEKAFNSGKDQAGAFIIAGQLATSYQRDGDFQLSLSWTDKQIENARDNLPSDSAQLVNVLAECDARKSKLKDKIKAAQVTLQ